MKKLLVGLSFLSVGLLTACSFNKETITYVDNIKEDQITQERNETGLVLSGASNTGDVILTGSDINSNTGDVVTNTGIQDTGESLDPRYEELKSKYDSITIGDKTFYGREEKLLNGEKVFYNPDCVHPKDTKVYSYEDTDIIQNKDGTWEKIDGCYIVYPSKGYYIKMLKDPNNKNRYEIRDGDKKLLSNYDPRRYSERDGYIELPIYYKKKGLLVFSQGITGYPEIFTVYDVNKYKKVFSITNERSSNKRVQVIKNEHQVLRIQNNIIKKNGGYGVINRGWDYYLYDKKGEKEVLIKTGTNPGRKRDIYDAFSELKSDWGVFSRIVQEFDDTKVVYRGIAYTIQLHFDELSNMTIRENKTDVEGKIKCGLLSIRNTNYGTIYSKLYKIDWGYKLVGTDRYGSNLKVFHNSEEEGYAPRSFFGGSFEYNIAQKNDNIVMGTNTYKVVVYDEDGKEVCSKEEELVIYNPDARADLGISKVEVLKDTIKEVTKEGVDKVLLGYHAAIEVTVRNDGDLDMQGDAIGSTFSTSCITIPDDKRGLSGVEILKRKINKHIGKYPGEIQVGWNKKLESHEEVVLKVEGDFYPEDTTDSLFCFLRVFRTPAKESEANNIENDYKIIEKPFSK